MKDLLTSLLDLGVQMQKALSDNDMDLFTRLLSERQQLVDALQVYSDRPDKPEYASTFYASTFEALSTQDAALAEAMAEKERHLMKDLENIDLLRKADRSYSLSQPPRRLMNPNLQG